jgi:uncharacterized protein
MLSPMKKRIAQLKDSIDALGDVAVAFSGGVDSTLLVTLARMARGGGVLAVTLAGPVVHEFEVERARKEAERLGVSHVVVDFSPLEIPAVKQNSPDRCYHCKREMFSVIAAIARERGIRHIVDGTNADDLTDYRPGLRALAELGVSSPFATHQVTKKEIRAISKSLGISGFDRPPLACLLSRFPYGEVITGQKLEQIRVAECVLLDRGFRLVRVRYHGDVARIEVGKDEVERFFDPSFSREIAKAIKEVGFSYVTLDLGGYRTGSMNEDMVMTGKESAK